MSGCTNTLKPKPTGSKILSSQVQWNGGVLCINGVPLDGEDLNYVIGLISQAICDIPEIPDPVVIPTIEEEVISNVQATLLDADANYVGNTYFQFAALGYESLIYTNTSGSTKTYIVDAITNVGRNSIVTSEYGSSDVDMGVFKRDVTLVDSLVSEVSNNVSIFFNSTLNPGDINPTIFLINSSLTDKAEVELQNGESVLLKFKSKNPGTGFINKSILHIREKHI